jgi:hypothetical protein
MSGKVGDRALTFCLPILFYNNQKIKFSDATTKKEKKNTSPPDRTMDCVSKRNYRAVSAAPRDPIRAEITPSRQECIKPFTLLN